MWSDLKNKFMIYGDKILIGRVRYHKELLPVDIDYSIVHGGGEFRLNKEAKEIVIWGSSFDFGDFNRELALTADLPKKFEGYRVVFGDPA